MTDSESSEDVPLARRVPNGGRASHHTANTKDRDDSEMVDTSEVDDSDGETQRKKPKAKHTPRAGARTPGTCYAISIP